LRGKPSVALLVIVAVLLKRILEIAANNFKGRLTLTLRHIDDAHRDPLCRINARFDSLTRGFVHSNPLCVAGYSASLYVAPQARLPSAPPSLPAGRRGRMAGSLMGLVVFVICGDPVFCESFLRNSNIKLPTTDHVAHEPL
jgi:hypothetical protein